MMEASCHERAAGKDRGPILFHADDGPANGGGFIEYLVELPDREFAIVGHIHAPHRCGARYRRYA